MSPATSCGSAIQKTIVKSGAHDTLGASGDWTDKSPGVATPGFLGIADYCSGFAFFCANNHSYNFRSAYDGFQLSWPTPGYSV